MVEYRCSRVPASIFLDDQQLPLDFLALSDIVGADFFAEGALAHKAFLDQKLDKGSLHNPTGRICRADYKGAPWIRRVVGCGGGLSRLTYGGSNLYCSLSDWGH